ncbi:MAG: glycogen debranching N-terminal domain-containing protein [Candidatus Limnocylindria bacterium]
MPDDIHDFGRHGEQPFLHDLSCLLAAPMQAWTTADGSIALDAGAQGVYLGDMRIVRGLSMQTDGWSVAHLATDEGVPRRQVLRAVVRRGGGVIDPEILLMRERVITGDALTESIAIVNASRGPVTVVLGVHFTPDATPMDVVKAGGTRHGGVRVNEGGWSTEDKRVSVRLSTDGTCARDDLGFDITWHLVAPPGGSAAGSWALRAVDTGAVVTAPSTRDVAATLGRVAVPEGREFDVGRLLRRAFDDLDGLELAMPGLPDARFLGAGAPWFLTLFGRDSIIAASLLLRSTPHIAHGTLAALARLQGTDDDVASAEEPGKIIHELRREVTHHLGGSERFVLPPRYYGTVDATPLWISLLHDAWRAGMPPDDIAALAPNLEAAVGWLRAAVAADPRGFLAYHDRTGSGLANQGWKDSGDAIRWADGSRAVGPIALCEVQGFAARAARQAAELLDALGRDGAANLRSLAEEMAERFRAAFWVTDSATGVRYPAMALDAQGHAVDGIASNMGHLLGTGILEIDEQRAVVDRLMDPSMFSGFGIRTLSTTNGGYWPMRYHAGAVWPHDTAMIIDGMLADGFAEEARTVAEGLLAAAASFDWRLPELFAGVSRNESARAIPYPAACRPHAWSAAAAVVVALALGGSVRGDAPAGARATGDISE